MPHDYKKERRDYYGYGAYSEQTAEQKRHRREKTGRDEARATLKKTGKVKAGQDVHHINITIGGSAPPRLLDVRVYTHPHDVTPHHLRIRGSEAEPGQAGAGQGSAHVRHP